MFIINFAPLGFNILNGKRLNTMTVDIFQNTILCKKCSVKMNPLQVIKNGFEMRAIECPKCNEKIIHPSDEQEFNNFVNLKNKEFNVKMRFVGNSYAVSIPREIVNFMQHQQKIMDDMVKLCFEDFGKISLRFNEHGGIKR
ncbi:hypothetical protein HOC86_04610 [archaeon]|nr:hypothetical protein [archaeon]